MNSTAFYENVSLALKLFPSGNMAPFDSVMTFQEGSEMLHLGVLFMAERNISYKEIESTAIDRRFDFESKSKVRKIKQLKQLQTFVVEKIGGEHEEWVFNQKDQLCSVLKKVFIQGQVSETCKISSKITQTKDGKMLMVPMIKKHVLGDAEMSTIEMMLLDTTLLTLIEPKIRISIKRQEDWSYDLTPTLTNLKGFQPYLYFLG